MAWEGRPVFAIANVVLGTSRHFVVVQQNVAFGGKADFGQNASTIGSVSVERRDKESALTKHRTNCSRGVGLATRRNIAGRRKKRCNLAQ